jgi:spore germination cell wall hydrolase CwlJ-like protein
VRVILNRAARHYQSDGTIQGTIFHPAAFSWTQYEMVDGHYTKVAFSTVDIAFRAAGLLRKAQGFTKAWARCVQIAARVEARVFTGPLFDKLTNDVMLYDNLALATPAWATPDKLIVQIGHHSFFVA